VKSALLWTWRALAIPGVALLVLLAIGAVVLWRLGALKPERLAAVREAVVGEAARPAAPSPVTEGAELERREMEYQEQVRRREGHLADLAAALAADEKRLRDERARLEADRAALAKERADFAAARGPQAANEEQVRLKAVYKSIREMPAKEQVEVLVKYTDDKLVQVLKLYKAEAAAIWPVLRQHPEMAKPVTDAEPRRSRFDVVWEKYNKPDPLPMAP
jgi:hypothetical protein